MSTWKWVEAYGAREASLSPCGVWRQWSLRWHESHPNWCEASRWIGYIRRDATMIPLAEVGEFVRLAELAAGADGERRGGQQ